MNMPSASFSGAITFKAYSNGGRIPNALRMNTSNQIWFTTTSGSEIGLLTPQTISLDMYYLNFTNKPIWWIDLDAQDRLWFITTAVLLDTSADYVGYYDKPANSLTIWSDSSFTALYGIRVDRSTGAVWFASRGAQPSIFRLDPNAVSGTDNLTRWRIGAYDSVQDLELDTAGNVWVTVPWNHHALLRLSPTAGNPILTAWTTPSTAQAPFMLQTAASGEVWFTEFDPTANSLARFGRTANTLDEFQLPMPAGYPAGLFLVSGLVWANASAGSSVLTMNASTPASGTLLTPQQSTPQVSTSRISPTVIINQAFSIHVIIGPPATINSTGSYTDPFTAYPYPDNTCNVVDDPYPFAIISAGDGSYWLGSCDYLLKFRLPEVYLPLAIR
jgi:streptogramin lyase